MGLLAPALPRVDLQMPPQGRLDDDLFFAICQANRDYRIERNARGDIQIMPPTGALTGKRNSDLLTDLNLWARRDGRGLVFDSSTGFNLPNGATRSPDVAWVLRERLARLSEAERRGFLPLAPDLVIELASATDAVPNLLAKMQRIPRQRGTARLADPARAMPGPGLRRRLRTPLPGPPRGPGRPGPAAGPNPRPHPDLAGGPLAACRPLRLSAQ